MKNIFLTAIAALMILFAACEDTFEAYGSGRGDTPITNPYDVTNFTCLKTLTGHSWILCSVAYSPDGTKIVSSSKDGTIKIWDANAGQCLKTLDGDSYHTAFVISKF
ncbi:MAG: hypothetical protein II304_03495, partial [Bacteroidales bacterium]|nr:hypothetical protein [Bacteroidales bacterium]